MGNIHVKLYDIWISGSGVDVVEIKSFQTNNRQRLTTIAHLEPEAQVS